MTKTVKKANKNFVNKNLIIRYNRENKKTLDLMINWHIENTMNSMIDRTETRSAVDETSRDPSSRLNSLPEDVVNYTNRFLGGKRKTKKRSTRRRKTRKH